tara:strand:+ start:210 stop:374 length:165 start_codon:yes stop_codon:yes gene_type:complete
MQWKLVTLWHLMIIQKHQAVVPKLDIGVGKPLLEQYKPKMGKKLGEFGSFRGIQ